MSLNNEKYKTRLTFIDLNSVELKYYLFMTSLDIWSESCHTFDDLSAKSHSFDDLSAKIFFPIKQKV